MSRTLVISALLLTLSLGAAMGQIAGNRTQPPVPASQPTPAQQALHNVMALARAPRALKPQEEEALKRERFPLIIKAQEDMETLFPQEPEIHDARWMAAMAAGQLAILNKDAQMAQKARALDEKLMNSAAPQRFHIMADAHLTLLGILMPGATSLPTDKAHQAIRDFAARYAKGEQAPDGALMAVQLAMEINDPLLLKSLEDDFIKQWPGRPEARLIRQYRGENVNIGELFKAELTTLEGKKITLPDDFKGKVVVVDFWATWCGPCIRELPRVKQAYAKYKDRGVVFIGINLDQLDRRDNVVRFVKEQGMDWPQSFSGKGWDDPAAQRYGVRNIPAVIVVGPDGRIADDKAATTPTEQARLQEAIEQALAGKSASAPAAATAPAP